MEVFSAWQYLSFSFLDDDGSVMSLFARHTFNALNIMGP